MAANPSDLAPDPGDLARVTKARRLAKTGQAKRIRQAADASHRDMGAEVGVAGSTIYRWEEGLTRPGWDHALRWEAALARLVDELGW